MVCVMNNKPSSDIQLITINIAQANLNTTQYYDNTDNM